MLNDDQIKELSDAVLSLSRDPITRGIELTMRPGSDQPAPNGWHWVKGQDIKQGDFIKWTYMTKPCAIVHLGEMAEDGSHVPLEYVIETDPGRIEQFGSHALSDKKVLRKDV